jgi:hypothetical protein
MYKKQLMLSGPPQLIETSIFHVFHNGRFRRFLVIVSEQVQ